MSPTPSPPAHGADADSLTGGTRPNVTPVHSGQLQVLTRPATSILTKQRGGFLRAGPYPFTHSLAAYTGCAFGSTTCGLYCYAASLPNWTYGRPTPETPWGGAVIVKENAPDILESELGAMQPEVRRALRIIMSASTDPYQPLEATWRLTRRCLEVFAAYDDLDLLLIQTRAPLVTRDYDLLAALPYACLSMTVETDDHARLKALRGGPLPAKRLEALWRAVERGIPAQAAISPCLPYTEGFAEALVGTGVRRIVVDTFVEGDGARGARTARSPYAAVPGWRETAHAHALAEILRRRGIEVGWSAAGFAGIPPRCADAVRDKKEDRTDDRIP